MLKPVLSAVEKRSPEAEGATRLYGFCVVDVETPPPAGLHLVRHRRWGLIVGAGPGPLDTREAALGWVEHHARVVDDVWRQQHAVIPMRFGFVFTGPTPKEAKARAYTWLGLEEARLERVMTRVRNCEEFGVEVWCNRGDLAERLTAAEPELAEARTLVGQATPGLAFLLRQRYQQALERALEQAAGRIYRRCHDGIRVFAADVFVDRIPPRHPQQGDASLLLKLSCLVDAERKGSFFSALQDLEDRDEAGLSLRVSGPWPPYSFVLG